MLPELAPILERRPSGSAAWSLALAQTGGGQFYQPIFCIQSVAPPKTVEEVRRTRKLHSS